MTEGIKIPDRETVILRGSEWLRGENNSCLHREDNKMCCLGVAAMHFGADISQIDSCPGLSDVEVEHLPKGLKFLLDHYPMDDYGNIGHYEETDLCNKLYGINDRMTGKHTKDNSRCEELNRVLGEANAPFRFKFVATK